jgi:HEAT repeat protein
MTSLTTYLKPARGTRALAVAAALVLPSVPWSLAAQSIADRVAAAGDAEVRMTYATRVGVCGDGRNAVGFGRSLDVYPSMETYGSWSGVDCEPGAARVSLTMRDRTVAAIRTRVGGTWSPAGGRVVDLGVVRAADAAAYFLGVAERVEGKQSRHALLASVIADSADVVPGLLRLARNAERPREVRRRAVMWVGQLGDATMVPVLERFAQEEGEESVAEAALVALSHLADDAGIPSLIRFARSARTEELRGKAVFWLGQSDNERAHAEVRAIARDASNPVDVRAKAIFAIGHGDQSTPEDAAFLRTLFGQVQSGKLRDQILMAAAQREDAESQRWLVSVARDGSLPIEVRKKAIFWASQSDLPTAELTALYDALTERALREHAIFALSQRDDKAATDKLLAIARGSGDMEVRKKALFWLAQKDDPEITKMIGSLVTGP